MLNKNFRLASVLSIAGAALAVLSVTGCSMQSSAPASSVAGSNFSGQIMGGGQPIANANLQLYAPSTNGYGAASAPLFTRGVTSDANGRFNFTGAYTCPSPSTPVYLTITGGNPGLPAGTNNTALALMGLLGYCGDLTPSSFFVINEVTTVAAVWALSPFMLDYAHIGTSSTNVQGLSNAFATAQLLVDIRTGRAPGSAPSIALVPTAEINTLGAILASCVNSNGSTSPSAGCGRLFTAATPFGGHTPTDTIAAALAIARNPGNNVNALFNRASTIGSFTPLLAYAPPDWTISLDFVAPDFQQPYDLAIDSQGNAWVLAQGTTSPGSSNISVLSSTSGVIGSYPQNGAAYGHMAIDPYDGPWLTNNAYNSVARLGSSGGVASGNYNSGGIVGPGPIAFDGYGNVWVGNNNATVTKLNASGSSGINFPTNGASAAVDIALDPFGAIWMTDSGADQVEVLSNNGAAGTGSPYSGAGLSGPFGIAVDSSGGAWVANNTANSLSHLTGSGTAVAGSPYSGAGLSSPVDLQVDGLGNVWVVNTGNSSVSEFLNTGIAQSGGAGYGSSMLYNPFRAAIDKSGNVWVANLGTTTAGTGMITEIVGAAAPVVTPASVAIRNNALNQRP
ncbi:NHL repeat-containing protein [Edaphobacter flagellatus]|uniref:NHL repeat-containing protein n=1 Tax=Edaphobacter flagellatus TaxID=1933044 RepID=UPI0021B2558E|nr:NHL repeat-containing protein [Edaphobacter flagellatus]